MNNENGNENNVIQQENVAQQEVVVNNKKNNSIVAVIVIAILVVLIIVISAVLLAFYIKSRSVVKEYNEAVEKIENNKEIDKTKEDEKSDDKSSDNSSIDSVNSDNNTDTSTIVESSTGQDNASGTDVLVFPSSSPEPSNSNEVETISGMAIYLYEDGYIEVDDIGFRYVSSTSSSLETDVTINGNTRRYTIQLGEETKLTDLKNKVVVIKEDEYYKITFK